MNDILSIEYFNYDIIDKIKVIITYCLNHNLYNKIKFMFNNKYNYNNYLLP